MTEPSQSFAPETQLFRDVFNASPVGIAVETLDGQPIFVNPAFCTFLGFSAEELRSKHCVDFSPAEDAEKDWALFQQLKAGSIEHYRLEKRYFRKDGSLVWGRLSISLLNSRPSPLVVAMVEDITEKKRTQEDLELVSREMAAAVTRCSHDFRYLWANQGYADQLKRPLNEIVGHRIVDVLGEDAFEALLPHFKRVLAGQKVHYEQETNFRSVGKRWISAIYTPTFDADGVTDGWVAVVLDVTDRKRAEETRFRHAAIVESYEDAIISKDLDAVITSWNIGAERIFGYKEEEVVGRPITILIPPELSEEENKILERLRAGASIEHYETKRLTKAGKQVDVSLTIVPSKDSTGRVLGFTKIAHEITQRKQAEIAVKESETRFRLVADTAPVLIWMSGVDKLCTYFNQPWLDFTGRSIEQELGNGWADGVHPDDLQRCLNTYRQSFDRREKFTLEYRLRHREGEYRWILDVGVPRFNEDGSFAGYIGICVDVTERKRTEEALQQREMELTEAQRLAGVGSWQWDARIDKVIWSEELYRLVGCDPKLPAPFFKEHPSLFTAESWERLQRVVKEALQTGAPYELDIEILSPESTTKWATARGEPLRDAGGQIIGLRGTVQDITERKRTEEALSGMTRKLLEAQEQERARIGRELHDDINQRLAMLALELEQLQANPSEVQTRLQELRKQTTELSNDVQALSHELHSSKLEYLGVVSGIKSWCKEFGERQKMEVDFKSDVSSVLPLEVGVCLFRVLQEALHNALKHSGVKRIEVQLSEHLNEVHLLIGDLGRGFDVEAALQGQGLGLTSMQERVRLLNGSIEIQSKPMGGTTIQVRVPLRLEHATQRVAG